MNFLVYTQNNARISSNGVVFESGEKPNLGFSFDSLYYEPGTNFTIKILAGVTEQLTSEEKDVCEQFCINFYSLADYPVYAYTEDHVYAGVMFKSEAEKKKLAYRIAEMPDHPASKWVDDSWERIKAVIMDNGLLKLDPDSVCQNCVVFMTTKEWDDFPKPDFFPPDWSWKWDFTKEEWVDNRDKQVWGINPDMTIYGPIMRNTAIANNIIYTDEVPKHPVSKWNGKAWDRVVFVIMEDGDLKQDPHVICDSCMLLYTQKEWNETVQPPNFDFGWSWEWDFINEEWIDTRDKQVWLADEFGLYIGTKMLSQIVEGEVYSFNPPVYQPSKLINGQWQQIYATIMDDGRLVFNSPNVCANCLLFMVRSEWEEFKQPPNFDFGWSWKWDFINEEWIDTRDKQVYVLTEDGLYNRPLLLTQVTTELYTMQPPPNINYKWTGEKWEEIVAVIMDTGDLRLNPTEICQNCLLFFTKEEWEKHPPYPKMMPLGAFKWDFTKEKWVDKRELGKLKSDLEISIRQYYENLRTVAWGAYIHKYEQETWSGLLQEAKEYTLDDTVSTPLIDIYINGLDQSPKKQDLVTKIIKNNLDFNKMAVAINAKQKNVLIKLAEAKTNADCDAAYLFLIKQEQDHAS